MTLRGRSHIIIRGKPPAAYFFHLTFLFFIFMSGCDGSAISGGRESQNSADYEAAGSIDSAGGTVEVTNVSSSLYGTSVVIPAGALNESKEITIKTGTLPAELPAGHAAAGAVIDLGPDGAQFSEPVRITVHYPDEDNDGMIDQTHISENGLVVLHYNDTEERWDETLQVARNLTENYVIIEAMHFSLFVPANYLPVICNPNEGILPETPVAGPYYFTLYFNYRYKPNIYKVSVAKTIDLAGNNATLYDTYAILEYDDFPDLFDRILDATQWTWETELIEYHTILDYGDVDLEDSEVVYSMEVLDETTIRFNWNFDYHDMLSSQQLTFKFAGTSTTICNSL